MPNLLDKFLRFRAAGRGSRGGSSELKLLHDSPLFDAEWYLKQNPDVAAEGVDPALHYLTIGAEENRNPSQRFDGAWYRERYPDTAAARINPLVHYLTNGQAEGREIRAVTDTTEQPELTRRARQIAGSPFFDKAWYRTRYRSALGETDIDPALHFLTLGAAQGFHPGPSFDVRHYLRLHSDVAAAGLNPLLHYLEIGMREGRQIASLSSADKFGLPILPDLLQIKLPRWDMKAFSIADGRRRISTLVSGLDWASLTYSGDGAALIVAALLSKRINARLRVVYENQSPGGDQLNAFFFLHEIPWNGDLELVYSPPGARRELSLSNDDFFLVNTCWKAQAARAVVDSSRIVNLVQEDERLLCRNAEERLRCSEILADPKLLLLIETHTLYDHLASKFDTSQQFAARSFCFEPVVRADEKSADKPPGGKRRFVLYLDENDPLSLPWRGLEAVEAAIEGGALDPQSWDFYFAGPSPAELLLLGEIRPQLLKIGQAGYEDDLRKCDLALCLHDSPHPGYPVLALAAHKVQLITSSYGAKTSLAQISPAIRCVEPSVSCLKTAIAEAARDLSSPPPVNKPSDWVKALEPALAALESRIGVRK